MDCLLHNLFTPAAESRSIAGRLHKVVKTQASSLLDTTINLAPVIMCRGLPPAADFVKET